MSIFWKYISAPGIAKLRGLTAQYFYARKDDSISYLDDSGNIFEPAAEMPGSMKDGKVSINGKILDGYSVSFIRGLYYLYPTHDPEMLPQFLQKRLAWRQTLRERAEMKAQREAEADANRKAIQRGERLLFSDL